MGGTDHLFWLTRRLCQSFLMSSASWLEQTVASSGLPLELPAAERVRLDHEETLSASPDEPPPILRNKVMATPEQIRTARLVSQIDLVISGVQWKLVLHTEGGQKDALAFNRMSLHRLLGALVGMAQKAEWKLDGVPEWLSAP
jgi:hypothetical protein